MTKTMTAILTAIILTLCLTSAVADCGYYANEGIITGWERVEEEEEILMIVWTCDGNEWAFFAEEGAFSIGDVVVLRMLDMNDCPDEYDEIVDVMFIEHLDEHGMVDWCEAHGLI